MFRTKVRLAFCLSLICSAVPLMVQQAASADSVVPSMVKFAGSLSDTDGKPLTGTVGVTFLLYKEQTGGSPLWLETQNVQADKNGHYSVMLGSATTHGLPPDIFVAGEARWLGVQASGQAEQARTLLLSVPYALKALDAESLGGKPASAFMAAPVSGMGPNQAGPQAEQSNEIVCSSGTACKSGFVPLFATNGGSAKVNDSLISQSGSTVTISGNHTIAGSESLGGNLGVVGNVNASSMTAAASANVIVATMSGNTAQTAAVTGAATASGIGNTYGVAGYTSTGNGVGVFGQSNDGGTGLYGLSNSGTGVAGFANSNSVGAAGVYGQMVAPITSNYSLPPAGVWGSTGLTGGTGVLATADDANAGFFVNNSRDGFYTVLAWSFDSNGYPFDAENISNHTGCKIDPAGNLNCTGTKNAVVPLDDGRRKVAMSAIESPENWFEDFGSAQLVNGVALVRLDRDFIQTVNTEKDYRVFPVPNGDCRGLYVTNKAANSFEVHELGGGTSNVSFDYRITAIRRKYETVRFADHTNDPDPEKMLEQMRKAKPASSTDPASVKPVSAARAGVSVAQQTNNDR